MTTFPGSPRLIKGGIVLMDADTGAVRRIIALQYNPDSLTRSYQIKAVSEGGDMSEAMRLTGPPVETIKVDVEIDATDQLEFPDQNPTAAQAGIHPQLAALETIIYPASGRLQSNNRLAQAGTLEILPMESPLALFIWNRNRVLPIRLTDLSVTEEAFDPRLNPIRAKVSLGMRVLNINDLGFAHRGGSLFMAYLQNKEQLAQRGGNGVLGALGLTGI